MGLTREQSLKILEINEIYPATDIIKKQYRIMALRCHPDKSTGSVEAFQNLTEAYEILLQNPSGQNPLGFSKFFSYLFENYKSNKIVLDLIDKVVSFCENKSLTLLENIDREVLIKIMEIIDLHSLVLDISPTFMEELQKIIDKKKVQDEHILLHPFIEDLFADHIYKMTRDGETYLIPLWHHELIYDLPDKKELHIICFPILPENLTIDSKNNLHCSVTKDICEVWSLGKVDFSIGDRSFCIPRENLHLCETQTVILYGEGISRMNINHIYDNNKKSDIYVHVTLNSMSSIII